MNDNLMISMGQKTNKAIEDVLSILKDAQLDYSPLTYYYTPITPYPRSITPKAERMFPKITLSDFQVMIYIHIPYCSRRCTFCPFFLDVNQKVPEVFVSALKEQIKQTLKKIQLPNKFNIYFGGGSPNLLSIPQLKEIIDCFSKKQIEEISIELHPEVFKNKDYFIDLSMLGINRVSIGLQSSEIEILKSSARGHDALTLKKIIPEIKRNNLLVNLDIMFGGLLMETIESAKNTFEYAFEELRPDWITAYQVCIHGGTAEKNRYVSNPEKYPHTKSILEMRSLRQKIAQKNGYRYLFGDYFSAGQLNPKYKTKRWGAKTAVIGIGPGTHSYMINQDESFGLNWYAPFSIENYLRMVKAGIIPVEKLVKLNKEHIDSWRIISQLKTSGHADVLQDNDLLDKLSKIGLLKKKSNLYQLSETGILIEDLVYAVLMPIKMWKKLSQEKKKEAYTQDDAKYDWFFDPNTVLKFRNYLDSL